MRLVQKHHNLRRIFLTFLFTLVLSGSVVPGSQFAVEAASSCSFSPSTGDIYGYRISQNEIFDACTTEGTATALPD